MSGLALPAGLRAASAPAPAARQSLGQDDFLRLLTTQLRSQDPLSPQDSSEFVAQLAQFASVSGISEMNASLKSLASGLAEGRLASASGLIGRLVESETTSGRVVGVGIAADGSTTLDLGSGTAVAAADVRRILPEGD